MISAAETAFDAAARELRNAQAAYDRSKSTKRHIALCDAFSAFTAAKNAFVAAQKAEARAAKIAERAAKAAKPTGPVQTAFDL